MQIGKKEKVFAVVMGIVWGILIVVFICSVNKILHYGKSYYFRNPEYILEYVVKGDYGNIYWEMDGMLICGMDVKDYPEYKELTAMRDYMEGAVHEKMYRDNGMEELANRYQEKKDKAIKDFGELSFAKEEIDEALGLTE